MQFTFWGNSRDDVLQETDWLMSVLTQIKHLSSKAKLSLCYYIFSVLCTQSHAQEGISFVLEL